MQRRRTLLTGLATLVPVLLAACGRGDGSDLPSADAARWMEASCGIRFGEPPQVLRSAVVRARAASAAPVSVTVTVVLPNSEVEGAVAALANNRALHRRGQSETRYSYESFPEARPYRECELDKAQHVLYFRYVP